jgi:drug/metabolite transporter (DMT)-like permease
MEKKTTQTAVEIKAQSDNATIAAFIRKITSRKFWICVAAFLASIAVSISGIQTQNTTVASVGLICGIVSAAIYAAAEAAVDKSYNESQQKESGS